MSTSVHSEADPAERSEPRVVSIAGVDFAVRVDGLDSFRMIDRRFDGFLEQRRPAEGALEIDLRSALDTDERIPWPGSLRLSGADYSAVVAPDHRRATVSGPAAGYALDGVLRAMLARSLVDEGVGLLLHASAVVLPTGRAVVFVGVSGAGKSTVASNLYGTPLSDEAVAVRIEPDDRVLAVGTPYWQGANRRAEVGAILHLQRGDDEAWSDLSPAQAAGRLFGAHGPVLESGLEARALRVASRMAAVVPVHAAVRLGSVASINDWLGPRLAQHLGERLS